MGVANSQGSRFVLPVKKLTFQVIRIGPTDQARSTQVQHALLIFPFSFSCPTTRIDSPQIILLVSRVCMFIPNSHLNTRW